MPLKIIGYVLTYLFGLIFKTSKETAQTAKGDLVKVFSAISKIGAHRIKEFLATVPIFIEFFIHLIKEKDKLEKSRQLLLVGAAAALSTLVGFLIVSVLGSWTVQIALIISFPLLGIPLFLATGLAITTIVVLFIWLVVFVLNKALSDDPEYQVIRDGYLSAPAKKILSDIETLVNDSQSDRIEEASAPSDPTHLYKLVETQLLEQGGKTDADKIADKLEKIQSKLSKKSGPMKRFVKTADRVDKINSTSL